MDLTRTHEIKAKKVSLVKISDKGRPRKETITGYEYAPPRLGKPYSILLSKGKKFKTSPVKDIQEVYNGIMIRTKNSMYRIMYRK